MSNNIEDCIAETCLPVNTIAMANRLIAILKEANTNCAQSLKDEQLLKFKKDLWLINSQVYGQMGVISMIDEWHTLVVKNGKENE